MEVIEAAELNDFAEFRELPPLSRFPVSVLLANRFETQMWAGRPCVPVVCQRDQPFLVVSAIRRVLALRSAR